MRGVVGASVEWRGRGKRTRKKDLKQKVSPMARSATGSDERGG